jgi:hypothetical protein
MPGGPDDLTPDQRGKRPTERELAARKKLSMSRIGRWGRPRSWATVVVAIAAVIACYLLLRHA